MGLYFHRRLIEVRGAHWDFTLLPSIDDGDDDNDKHNISIYNDDDDDEDEEKEDGKYPFDNLAAGG